MSTTREENGNVYLRLTREFNEARPRALLAGGQAVVLHRLAIMSKDGDWVLREDEETLRHVLQVLSAHGARYRFGAPLDLAWMRGGWSAHFEFPEEGLRVRTDFMTRPPRLTTAQIADLWRECDRNPPAPGEAKLGAENLILTKQTNREKDYAVIGELARLLDAPALALRHSRSARDIMEIAARHPDLAEAAVRERACLAAVAEGREVLAAALDAERRQLIAKNEARLKAFEDAAGEWAKIWPEVQRQTSHLALPEAHELIARTAKEYLPCAVDGG